jgi:exodeoxyribonuclease VII large subunit
MADLFDADQPFDPARMRAAKDTPAPKPTPAPDRPLTVSQLANTIARSLKDAFPARVRVEGEVSGLKRQTHAYFTLKDDQAVLSCVMFAPALRKLGTPFEDGQRVIATGRIDHWPKGGRTQLYTDTVTPVGRGALEAQLRQRIEDARANGWLDPERKRPLPTFPRAVAVVTSRTGAALQDVIDTARRRCPAVDLLTIDTRVQGDAAAPQIERVLRFLARDHERLRIDAIVLTRGGGSIEDLWAFNETRVARAVVESPVPVVAAIGHETDTTLAELVADARAATPTQAAMRLTPDREALAEHTAQLGSRLASTLRRTLAAERRHLAALARRPALADPVTGLRHARAALAHRAAALAAGVRHRIASARRRTDALAHRLSRHRPEAVYARRAARLDAAGLSLRRAVARRLAERAHADLAADLADAATARTARDRDRLAALNRELVLASPMHVLQRGYSVTTRADGSLVRAAAELAPGDIINTRLADGAARSTVNRPETDAPPTPRAELPRADLPKRAGPAPAPRRTRRKRPRNDDNQLGLF